MALKAKINKETHEALSDELKKEYIEKDGMFVLDVVKVEGLTLENVDGLKSTVEKLRASEKSLTASVKAIEQSLEAEKAKFAGIDVEQARDAISKIDDIKNWDGETKIKEAVIASEAKFKAQLEELNTKHKAEKESLTAEVNNSQDQLRDALINSKITEAISKSSGNIDLLMPHVKSRVNMVKDANGKWKPEVVNNEGTPRIGDNEGNPMSIMQLVEEMKTQTTFAAAFPGANNSGTGKQGDNSESGKHKGTEKVTVIKASDDKAKSDNLEDIASGKVKVDMTPAQ